MMMIIDDLMIIDDDDDDNVTTISADKSNKLIYMMKSVELVTIIIK